MITSRYAFSASRLLNQNLGEGQPGNIEVNVFDSIELNDTSSDGIVSSSILSDAMGGSGGDIIIVSKRLVTKNGGAIAVAANSQHPGGNIALDISESIDVRDVLTVNPIIVSFIGSLSIASGKAGNITVSTEHFNLQGGGSLGSVVFGSGNGGSVTVRANAIEVIGTNPFLANPTAIASSSFGSGQAGNLTIETGSLIVRDGASVNSSAFSTGDAGSLTLNATRFVEVSSKAPGSINSSQIEASAIIRDRSFQQAIELPTVPEANSGNVTINTPELRLLDSGLVNVSNDGSGNSGSLSINADSILLDESGGLTASTASGQGGNIIINANNSLIMRRNSFIAAEAGGAGNGGNITINADVLAALENSDIEANALEGAGGNIAINSAGIFGTQFREALTPNSDITASSQFGLEGSVTINNPEIDPSSGLVELPVAIGDRTDKVIVGCGVALGSSFIVTGRGGLPADPTAPMRGETIWEDMRRFEDRIGGIGGDRTLDDSTGSDRTGGDRAVGDRTLDDSTGSDRGFDEVLSPRLRQAAIPNPQLAQPDARNSLSLVEATGWKLHPDGTVELVAAKEDRNASHLEVPSTCNIESNYGKK